MSACEGPQKDQFVTLRKMDLAVKWMEQEETMESEEKGLPEIIIRLDSREVKALLDTGNEVTVLSETH